MKIAIAGYGIEGEANYHYWSQNPANQLTIVDEQEQPKHPLPAGVPTILGPDALQKLDDFDLVIRTAGLPPYKLKTTAKVWTATNEFFEKCQAPIIGVTGTKGKGTTTSLIASIFEASGRKTWTVGNIGIAAVSLLDQIQPDDIVAFELSSFQLWDLERSPQTAVVLLIEPEHLNVHRDMEDYVRAKGTIRRYQGNDDVCIYHPTNRYAAEIAASNSKGRTLRYGIAEDGGVYVRDGSFWAGEQEICSVEALQLIGEHNKENACAAITVALQHGIDPSAIEEGLRRFKGLPHRIEFVRNLDGVDYYNDSFSSSTPATMAAVTSFTQPEIVIIGGIDRGGDFSELGRELKERDNLKELILIGEIRHKLAAEFKDVPAAITVFDGQTMDEIVTYARSRATAGDVVLLSPGCASFDMFKDFYDRGDQFRTVVNALQAGE